METREVIIRKGREAEYLLDEEGTLFAAFEELLYKEFLIFQSTEPEDEGIREASYFMVQSIGKLKNQLEAYIEDGKVEQHNNKLEAEQREREKGN